MTHDADTARYAEVPDVPDDATAHDSGRETQCEAGGALGAVGGAILGMGAAGPAGALAGGIIGVAGGAIAGGAGGRPVVADAGPRDEGLARSVGSDDLPPGLGGEGEPDPLRNPGDLGDRIRRPGPSGDRVFDDTDRELPSDRDFEGGDEPFGEGGQLPLGVPPLEPGGI